MKLIGLAIYLGIGAMLHALFVGPQFDWSSAWTLGWLFGWPIMFLLANAALILALTIVAVVICCLYWWLDVYANWRETRKRGRP